MDMDYDYTMLLAFIEAGGFWSPLIFVVFHVLRQYIFIPVAVVCMAGGVMFGAVFGTLLSLIGLWLSSVIFYFMIIKMPKLQTKLEKLDERTLKFGGKINVKQASILRLIPFIHFHLLNFYLIGNSKSFADYAKAVFWSNIPLAFFYTVFGHSIAKFSPTMMLIIFSALIVLLFFLREKKVIIKWSQFFGHT